MYYHIILTEKCNMNCRYCYEKSMEEFDNSLEEKFKFDFSAPCDTQVDIEKLKKFIKKEDVLIFYGGEPLLKMDKIKEIMDAFPENRFCMQTNGKLLDKLDSKYMNRMSRILVSIDGDKERTDYNRGKGVYDSLLSKIDIIRERGYTGEIVARMTISFSDIFSQVKHLIDLNKFDSVHWQLDAGFYETDYDQVKFTQFVKEYNSGIKELVGYWVEEIKKGNVVKLYPFLGIFESLYFNLKTKLRCGAGHSGYAITTDGKIAACPIMNNIEDFYCGDLESDSSCLKTIDVVEPCTSCKYLDICGGRCLYANHAKLWPEEGMNQICETIIYLIEEIKSKMISIKEAITGNIVSIDDFSYEKYFGPEIIP